MILEQNITTKILKGIMVSNGKPTRDRLSRGENSRPIASLNFLNGRNICILGMRYHGSGCFQRIHSDQRTTK